MKRTILQQSFLVISFFSLYAQEFSMTKWHSEGIIDLISGETLYGTLKYDLENNQLFLVNDSLNKTFSPRNATAFQFRDAITGKTRFFFSLEFKNSNGQIEKMFFELLFDGKALSLLSRERILERIEVINNPFFPATRSYRVYFLQYDFYVMNQYAEIFYCGNLLNDLLKVLPKQKQEIKNYIKHYKLNTTVPEDMIKIVQYYNQLEH
ncbi:MAG: hypothetical protein NZM38_01510 [Cytophagales bacterium]|nr:hypothetical protein [Cytophagales bacterium]MDW8383428.1 hypothetical protein [Flammeovirgaceae bacterium]